MSEQPAAVIAAIPAAAVGLLGGTFLLGQALRCSGELAAALGGATGRAAFGPMLRHALTHPVDLLTYALPILAGA